MRKISKYLNKTFFTKVGDSYVIKECSKGKALVEFADGNHIEAVYVSAIKGNVRNPFRPSVYGVGFIGIGKHNSKDLAYQKWIRMLQRCYDPIYQEKQPTYIGCSVCEEWHNFQNFAEWLITQPNYSVKGYELDKDILVKGNKIYNSSVCSIVPKEVNTLLIRLNNDEVGVYPLLNGKYKALIRISVNGKSLQKHLGTYSSKQEAFSCYKLEKLSHIKNIADKYKETLSEKVYKSLLSYTIEEF